jgi:branched-chain amino acid transport system permease protein
MVNWVNIGFNWVLLSSLYALVAIGFTLIFGVGNVLNLFHGASITLGAVAAWLVTSVAGMSVWVGIGAALLVGGLFNMILYMGLVSWIKHDPIVVAVVTLVVFLIVEHTLVVGMGTTQQFLPPLVEGQTEILGKDVLNNRIVVVVLSWVVIGILIAFVNRTREGQAILAVSMSRKGASLVGINADTVYRNTWIVAGVIAALSGVFLGSFRTVSPAMGLNPMILSFSVVILGGLGSIRGSLVGAYVIGLLEVLTTSLVSPNLSGITPLLALFIVLVLKPEGLFGRGAVGH